VNEPSGVARSHEQPGELYVQHSGRRRERSAESRRRVTPITPVPRTHAVPLSFAQERLWFLDQLGLVGTAYNLQTTLNLHGFLDVSALEGSLCEVVRRHECLRTRFESIEGSPTQVIDPAGLFALATADLSDLAESDRRRELLDLMRAEAQRPFDLSRGPLLRARLLKLAKHEHALVLTMHHIVTDGWSWAILHGELAQLYGAYVQRQASPLAELPIQYADYAAWQRQWLQGDLLQHQLQYWRDRLSGAPAELRLPTDRPRQSVASLNGARFGFELLPALRRALEQLARQEGATLFMVFLAAYQVLLSRYCGELDVVVGSPVAGRADAQAEGVIGFFVNTLALRTDLTGNPSFRELLRRVKDVTLGAYTHQDLPFEKLVIELRPERHLARHPIFQVVLSMQNYPHWERRVPGLTWRPLESDYVTAAFELTLQLAETAGGMRATFVYATDLFDRSTIERMAGHWRRILEGAVTDPDCPIERLPMLTAAERKRLLIEFNDTAAPYPQHMLVHELFERRVSSTPDAVAAVCEGEELTYAQLNKHANQLAHYLRNQGMQVGEYVPLFMRRCLQMLVAQLAVLKNGAAYVPIDPALPAERQLFILRDCSAKRVLAEAPMPVALAKTALQWIDCTALREEFRQLPATNLDLHVPSPTPAYAMYTSGSTGTPKGVIVPHHAVNRLAINNRYARIDAADCLAHCSNPMFDASTFEIWGALLNGARILIVPPLTLLDARRFGEVLIEQGVTVLWLTVGLFAQYQEVLAPAFKRLRYLLTGGDVVEPGMLRRVLRNSPPQHLLNAYGPTECTTFSTTYLVEAMGDEASNIPIGRPIANARIYILDTQLQPVPIGVVGEMYIGGAGVALGYLNRPELTRERFIANPFGAVCDDGPLYRSGDLAKWRADGNIEFVGRNDEQVKLRGFRVEPGEIEAQLARHKDVKEAIVVVREDVSIQKCLVAYVTPYPARDPSVEQLRAHLAQVLPEYMIPSAFVLLDSLPLTSNGKVDKRLLPAPGSEAYSRREYEEPQGDLEQSLATIWQALLKIEKVGRDDNFFDLGGHSLLAVKALFETNRACRCALNVRDMYGNPTPRELAKRIRAGRNAEDLVDLQKESALDEEIVAQAGPRRNPARAVLVTGGTGFVGRFLLAELLRSTDATVYCLVRAPSKQQASVHLRTTLVRWGLWREDFESRLIATPGDMRLQRLGLEEQSYQLLSMDVDAIYHCATSMNHLETYAMARRANVESARELLKLAASGRPKSVNYISTLSVFSSTTPRSHPLVAEISPTDHERHASAEGYAASKWVAEKIFTTAVGRGIPCNIFRLGLVWADSQQGRYDELQREYRLFKSCLLSGCGIANYRYDMAPVPVDYVVRAILGLANHHASEIFHICSAGDGLDQIFERCNEIAGTSLELIPQFEWISRVKHFHQQGQSLPIVPLIEFAFQMDESEFYERRRMRTASVRFECARTHDALSRLGIELPGLNDEWLQKCLRSML
jgi:myxalamid-type nonribosomal peptide synthetase MxaA